MGDEVEALTQAMQKSFSHVNNFFTDTPQEEVTGSAAPDALVQAMQNSFSLVDNFFTGTPKKSGSGATLPSPTTPKGLTSKMNMGLPARTAMTEEDFKTLREMLNTGAKDYSDRATEYITSGPDRLQQVYGRAVSNFNKRRSLNPNYHQDINMLAGTRDLNLSGKSLEETRALRRMADAVNNKVYRGFTTLGGGVAYGNGGGTSWGPQIGELYQRPKLSTVDTEQFDRMAGYEKDLRAEMLRRQQAALDVDLENDKNELMAYYTQSGMFTQEELRQMTDQYTFNREGAASMMDDFMKRRYDVFSTALRDLQIPAHIADILIDKWDNGGPAISLFMSTIFRPGATPPDYLTMAWNDMAKKFHDLVQQGRQEEAVEMITKEAGMWGNMLLSGGANVKQLVFDTMSGNNDTHVANPLAGQK